MLNLKDNGLALKAFIHYYYYLFRPMERTRIAIVTGHFSVKVDFTQFRKYRSLCNRQVKHIGVEHLLFFRIRNELQFVKARKVISLEFPSIC